MSLDEKSLKYDYETLINLKVSISCCVIGLLQVLVGLFMLICAFVFLGGFCENLECDGFTSGIGFFVGFPILVPGILGLVVVGTRHMGALYAYMLTNVLVFIFSVVHTILTNRDMTDFWDGLKDLYDADKCRIVSSRRCVCEGSSVSYPYKCDMIKIGHDNNWIVFGLSIVAIALCVCGVATSLIGRALKSIKKNSSQRY